MIQHPSGERIRRSETAATGEKGTTVRDRRYRLRQRPPPTASGAYGACRQAAPS